MGKEVLNYLSADEADTIEYYACDLPSLIETNPDINLYLMTKF